jgi:tellurite resistance protein TehA-like permease
VPCAALTRAQPAALAAIAAWSAGVALYLVITVLVATRLVLAGLGPQEPTAPYWVAMGAASITVMYATASMQLGTAAGLPLIHGVGTAAAWPAAAAWALSSRP